MSKLRFFHIDDARTEEECVGRDKEWQPFIEYSAYDALKAENASLRDELHRSEKVIVSIREWVDEASAKFDKLKSEQLAHLQLIGAQADEIAALKEELDLLRLKGAPSSDKGTSGATLRSCLEAAERALIEYADRECRPGPRASAYFAKYGKGE